MTLLGMRGGTMGAFVVARLRGSPVGCGAVKVQHGYAEVATFNDEHCAHHWFERRLSSGALG